MLQVTGTERASIHASMPIETPVDDQYPPLPIAKISYLARLICSQ